MDNEKVLKLVRDKKENILRFIRKNKLSIFLIVCLFLVFYRVTCNADPYDEMYNLNVAYRLVLGQIPFYECWEAFQTGDFVLSLIIFPFVKLSGGTEGIVLYSRVMYLVVLCACWYFVYRVLKRDIKEKFALCIGFVCTCFQLHGLFYLWYDSVSCITLLLGCVSIYHYFKHNGKPYYLVFAGCMHGILALSYPVQSLLAVFISLLILYEGFKKDHNNMKVAFKPFLLYCLGGMIIIFLFLLMILFYVGIHEFLFGINNILSVRKIGSGTAQSVLGSIITCFLIINDFLIIPTIVLLYFYFRCFENKEMICNLCWGILICSGLNYFAMEARFNGLFNFLGYIALWAPLLYLLLKKEKMLLVFIWLPSICSCLAIGASQARIDIGPNKSWELFLPAAIVSFVFIVSLMVKYKIKDNCIMAYLASTILFMIFCNYSYVYGNAIYVGFSESRAESGIYKGIKLSEAMYGYVQLEKEVFDLTKGGNTIAVSATVEPLYLMTDLKPCVAFVSNLNWEKQFEYSNYFRIIPEYLFKTDLDKIDEGTVEFIEDYYDLFYENSTYINRTVQGYKVKENYQAYTNYK